MNEIENKKRIGTSEVQKQDLKELLNEYFGDYFVYSRERKPSLTIGELFAQYDESHAKVRARTANAMRAEFRRYFSDIMKIPATRLRPLAVQDWHNKLSQNHGEPTANRALTLLRTIYNFGEKWEIIDCRNPARAVRKFKEEPRERYVTTKEMPRILEAIERITSLSSITSTELKICLINGKCPTIWHAGKAQKNEVVLYVQRQFEILVERFALMEGFSQASSTAEKLEKILAMRKSYVEVLGKLCPSTAREKLKGFVRGYVFHKREEQADRARRLAQEKVLSNLEKTSILLADDPNYLRTHGVLLKKLENKSRAILLEAEPHGLIYEDWLIRLVASLYASHGLTAGGGNEHNRFVQLCHAIFRSLGSKAKLSTVRSRVQVALNQPADTSLSGEQIGALQKRMEEFFRA